MCIIPVITYVPYRVYDYNSHSQDDHNIEEFTSKWQKHSTFLIPIDHCKQLGRVYAFYSMENLLLELVLDHIKVVQGIKLSIMLDSMCSLLVFHI